MKPKIKSITLCLLVALAICSLGAINAEAAVNYAPQELSYALSGVCESVNSNVLEFSAPAFAAAFVAIPAFDFSKLLSVSKSEFEALQAKFGKLYVIDIKLGKDESYQFIIRRPTRQHLEIIASYGNDSTKINDFTIKNLVVAGNEKNELDDGLVFSAFNAETAKLIGEAQAFLSKA